MGREQVRAEHYRTQKEIQDNKGQRRQRFSRAYKQVDRLEVSAA